MCDGLVAKHLENRELYRRATSLRCSLLKNIGTLNLRAYNDQNMDDTIVDKALELGTKYFRNENYNKAKELFRKAVDLARSYDEQNLVTLRERCGLSKYSFGSTVNGNTKVYHPKYVRLLDNLAATYEKLGELSKALNYAEKMARIEPFNLKCYIRLGKVLQKQGNDREAYAAYKMGLKKSKEAYDQYSMEVPQKFIDTIQNQKNIVKERLTRKDSNKTASSGNDASDSTRKRQYINPIEEHNRLSKRKKGLNKIPLAEISAPRLNLICGLPTELIPLIFNEFSSKELMIVTLVCKSWQTRILAQPQLFQKFILNSCTLRQVLKFCDFICSLYPSSDDKSLRHSLEVVKYSSRTSAEEAKSVETLLSRLQNIHCEKLMLSIPSCTTAHLASFMASNVELCRSLKELSVIISLRADKPYEIDMLSRCENLKRLEVLIESSVVPIKKRISRTSSFIEPKLIPTWAEKLESFSLNCDQNKVKSFPFITLVSHFPANHLSRLCITGVTFSSDTNQFDWLSNFKFLKEIWFENNKSAKLAALMHLLRDYPLSNLLEKLTFREDRITSKFDMEETSENYFYYHNLQNLRVLDVMGSSISGLGLARILSYLRQNKIKKLNMGDCPYIKLQQFPCLNDTSVISPNDLLVAIPNLEELLVPQFGFLGDDTMKLFTEQVRYLENIKRVDLSLNPSITGVSIYELLKALKERRTVPLEHINLDGCPSVSHITVNMLKAQGLVKHVDCVYERVVWQRFGINSLKYQS